MPLSSAHFRGVFGSFLLSSVRFLSLSLSPSARFFFHSLSLPVVLPSDVCRMQLTVEWSKATNIVRFDICNCISVRRSKLVINSIVLTWLLHIGTDTQAHANGCLDMFHWHCMHFFLIITSGRCCCCCYLLFIWFVCVGIIISVCSSKLQFTAFPLVFYTIFSCSVFLFLIWFNQSNLSWRAVIQLCDCFKYLINYFVVCVYGSNMAKVSFRLE